MKLFSVSSIFLALSAASLLFDSAEADKPLRNGRFVRIRGRPRQARNFGRRVVRVQAQQPLFQEVRQARTNYGAAPVAPAGPAAPLPAVIVEQRIEEPAQSYGAPVQDRAEAAATGYGAAVAAAPQYGAPVEQRAEEAAPAYGAPVEQRAEEAAPQYGAPVEQRVQAAPAAYAVPQQQTYTVSAPAPPQVVEFVAARAPIPAAPIARAQPVANQYQASASSASSTRTAAVEAEPVAIVRSVYNAPGTLGYETTYNFDFEAENGIQQSAEGELRTVDDAEVVVMKGSYAYVDENGEDVLVTWYADETGYHAESSILPVAPAIPFEEQRIAVEAQIRFAQEEAAAASANEASASASSQYGVAAPAPEQFQDAQIVEVRQGLPSYTPQ